MALDRQVSYGSPLRTSLLDSSPGYGNDVPFSWTLESMWNLESPLASNRINGIFGLEHFNWDTLRFSEGQTGNKDPRFDPMKTMLDNDEIHLFDTLKEAKNDTHYSLLKQKLSWEDSQKGILAESGLTSSLVAGLMVGTVDPMNLAVGLFTGGSTTVMGAAFRAVSSALIATATNEVILHETQVGRTIEESSLNIIGDMVLSSAIGMGFHSVARRFRHNPEGLRDLVVQELDNHIPFGLPGTDKANQLGIRPQTKWNEKASFVYTTNPSNKPAFYRQNEHTIYIDIAQLKSQFERRAWRSPKEFTDKVTGKKVRVDALDNDHFREPHKLANEGEFSFEKWSDFVHQHEYLHTVHKQSKGESTVAYENRINDYALALLDSQSYQGIAHRPISIDAHSSHADMIHDKYDSLRPDGTRDSTILDQMVEEGGFGHAKADRHPDYIDSEGVAGPQRLSEEDVISQSNKESAAQRADIDRVTGYSDEQYIGNLGWTSKLVGALGLEKIKANPMMHGMNSLNAATRLYTMRLVPTPVNVGNTRGHTTPGDIETGINMRRVELAEAISKNDKSLMDYRLGKETDRSPAYPETVAEFTKAEKERVFKQSETDRSRYIPEYRARISRGLRYGDYDENPIIQKQINYLRQIFSRLSDEADGLGLFKIARRKSGSKELDLFGSRSFLPRIYMHDVLNGNIEEATTVITRWQIENSSRADAPDYVKKMVGNYEAHSRSVRNQIIKASGRLQSVEDFDVEGAGVSGTFKGRSIWVDDIVLAGENIEFGGSGRSFLENDINSILKQWMPQMHTDIEFTKAFGNIDMARQFSTIRQTAVKNAKKAWTDGGGPREKVINKFIQAPDRASRSQDGGASTLGKESEISVETTKSAEKDIEKLSAIRDVIRGVYSLSSDPLAISARSARVLTDMTHLSLMGNVMVSSVPDLGRIVMVNKLESLNTLQLAFADFKRFRKEMRSMRDDIGVGLDIALSTRVQAIIQHGDVPRYTGLERLTGRLTDINFVINILNPWNAIVKQGSGIATTSRLIKDLKRYKSGKLGIKQIQKLNAAGVNEDFMGRLLSLHEKYGEKLRGVEIPNASDWDLGDTSFGFDVGALHNDLRRVLSREVDKQIVTPGAGDIPLSLRKTAFSDAVEESLLGRRLTKEEVDAGAFKESGAQAGDRPGKFGKAGRIKREAAALYPHIGRVFGIYKSFIAASWGRVLIPSLQNKDSTELMGVATMILLGGMVKTLKDWSYDSPGPENLTEFLVDGFDQSGIGSWFMFANTQSEAIMNVGLRPALGVRTFNSSARWKASSVMGASVGQLIRAGKLAGDLGSYAMGDDFNSRSATNAYKLLPWQSLFYLRLPQLTNSRLGLDSLFDAVEHEGAERLSIYQGG